MDLKQVIDREIWTMDEDMSNSFNIDQFENLSSFAARKRYADEKLYKIGAGSARIVYRIQGGKVLKLAKNVKGIAQNKLECELGNDYYASTNLTKVFDCNPNNLWVLVEEAKKLTPTRFYQLTKVKLDDLRNFLNYEYFSNRGNRTYSKLENSAELWENEFVQSINDLMINYDMPAGDLGRLSSYGEVIRDGQPTVVLTDYGLNNDVYSTHYDRIREELGSYFEEGETINETSIENNSLKSSIQYITNYDFNKLSDIQPKNEIDDLYKNYINIVSNLEEVLKISDNEIELFNDILKVQDFLKNNKMINEDLVYWDVDGDTSPESDKYKLGIEAVNEGVKDCTNFFDLNSILNYVEFDKPLYSMIAKRKTAKFIYMSPKQYIYKIASNWGLSYEDTLIQVMDSKVDKYAEMMKSGSKAPVGYFRRNHEGQEGRHRALAAMKLGCKSIPVIEFIDISDNEFKNIINKFKGKSFEELDGIFKKIGFKNGISQLGFNSLNNYVNYNLNENIEDNINEVNDVLGLSINTADQIAKYVAKKNSLSEPKYIGEGNFGYAYDCGDVVIKITKDKSEGIESFNIKGEKNEYIADIFNIFHTTIQTASGDDKDLYIIILEKLDTNPDIKTTYKKLDKILERNYDGQGIASIIVDEYVHDRYLWDKEVGDDVLNSVLKNYPLERDFFIDLLAIADELRDKGISSTDFINPNNLGYKKSGNVGFFDLGFGDYYKEAKGNIERIRVGESKMENELDEEVLLYSDEEYDDENDSGLTNYEIYDQAIKIARDNNIRIDNSKELSGYIIEDNEVVGALFEYVNNEIYSFDIVISKMMQRRGYGKELVQYGMQQYEVYKEAYGDDLKLDIDVVNPYMKDLLLKHFDFRIIQKIGDDRFRMAKESIGEDELFNIEEMILESLGNVITERILSWIPKSKEVSVKDKCKFGGNGDGTSTACNQGDVSNLEISDIQDENSRKENKQIKSC